MVIIIILKLVIYCVNGCIVWFFVVVCIKKTGSLFLNFFYKYAIVQGIVKLKKVIITAIFHH